VQDAAVNYDVATEFALSQSCALNKVWYYSPPGTAQLATAASVWHITGTGTTGTLTAQAASPSWSGAAGSGWVSCSFSGTVLPAGKYKVSVYNAASVPDGWSPKDANTDYFRGGEGGGGITWGPLSAPNLAGASTAYTYDGSAGGATPPFQNGTTQAGQPTFSQGPPDRYPYLFAPVASPSAGSTQVYWVDVEVTPASQAQPATATAAGLAPAPAVTAPGTTLAHPAAAAAAAAAWPPVFTQVDISVTAGPTASRAQVPAAGLTDDDGTHAGPVTADRSP
jgi:hypothetical protein